jgi:4-hydroxybenzoate polyprenyltransferase
VTIPWVAAMALFASVEYGDFSSPIHGDTLFYTKLFLVVLASYLGATSGYAVNDYFDADMDTHSPIGTAVKLGVNKKALLGYAAVLGIPSLIIFFYLSIFAGFVAILQMLNILIYSQSAKGQTAYSNIFVVIPTALMPIAVFFVYTNQIPIEAILLFITYFFFEPGFTWSGVCRDMEIDKKRGVPTLAVKYGIQSVAKFILACWFVVLVMSIILFLYTNLGIIFLIGSILSAVMLLKLGSDLIKAPNPKTSFSTFIKSAGWFWFFSFSVIIDLALRMAGIVIFELNLLS